MLSSLLPGQAIAQPGCLLCRPSTRSATRITGCVPRWPAPAVRWQGPPMTKKRRGPPARAADDPKPGMQARTAVGICALVSLPALRLEEAAADLLPCLTGRLALIAVASVAWLKGTMLANTPQTLSQIVTDKGRLLCFICVRLVAASGIRCIRPCLQASCRQWTAACPVSTLVLCKNMYSYPKPA